MNQLGKRCVTIVASLILLLGGGLAVASPASAATCSGHGCSNKDPQATGCSAGSWTQEARDVHYRPDPWGMSKYAGRLELRGSNTCGSTQWTRFTPSYGGYTYKIRTEQPETGYATDWQNAGEWQTAWTNQIYSPTKCVRAHIITNSWAGTTEVYSSCI